MADISPYQYLNDSGVIVPDTQDILADVQTEYQDTLAPDLNVDGSTPQGVLINAEALARTEVVRNNAAVANQINPNIAGGVFLQAICALTGFDVPTGTFSVIENVGLAGVATTIIPAGQIASVGSGADAAQFKTVSTVTLAADGTATVNFQALEVGPIPAAAHALNTLINPVLGLETVDNANAAVPGVIALSDAEIRTLRNSTLALQGVSLPEAITSALYATEGVRSLSFRENIEATSQTIDGILLVAHSIWAAVQGGTDIDIATVLLGAKTFGANWNGDVSVSVVDPSSGQTYAVLFDRPTDVDVWIKITVVPPTSLGDPQASVQSAVLKYTQGLVANQPGFVTGAEASPFSIAAGATAQISGLLVSKCEVSLNGTDWQTTEIVIAIDEVADTDLSKITVIIGA